MEFSVRVLARQEMLHQDADSQRDEDDWDLWKSSVKHVQGGERFVEFIGAGFD